MPRLKPLPEGTPTEPIWFLKGLPYSEYRQTNWWRIRRERYVATVIDLLGCKRCQLCQLARFETVAIDIRFHVHHCSYERLGEELDNDLILLCAPCHNLVHFPGSHAARHWASVNADARLDEWAPRLHPAEQAA